MNYSFRLADPKGPFKDENGESFRFPHLQWSKALGGRVYNLMMDGKYIGQCSRARSKSGWYVLAYPGAHADGPVSNYPPGGKDVDEKLFDRINTWVGPFVNRHYGMEYILWTLGYIEKIGM